MVVTLLSALAAVTASPAISISAGISWQGQGKVKARQLHSSSELHGLNVRVSGSSRGRTGASDIDGGAVVLSDNKLYIRAPGPTDDPAHRLSITFNGRLQQSPSHSWKVGGLDLVSFTEQGRYGTWIYVDQESYEVKYGNRAHARQHIDGPWTFDPAGKALAMDGWEGFMAVKESLGLWALYFDVEDNGLRDKVRHKRILEVEVQKGEAIADATG